MTGFTYFWLLTLFIIQVMKLGTCLSKTGEVSATKDDASKFFVTLTVAICTGIALYTFPKV